MAKKEKDFDTINDGSHAIRKFSVGDFIIIFVLVLLCLTCILPFIHLAAKSISSNTAVMQKSVVLWPKGINFEAYTSIFQDGTLVHSFLYSVEVVAIFTLMGMDRGSTILNRIWKLLAPSRNAASSRLSGMEDWK